MQDIYTGYGTMDWWGIPQMGGKVYSSSQMGGKLAEV